MATQNPFLKAASTSSVLDSIMNRGSIPPPPIQQKSAIHKNTQYLNYRNSSSKSIPDNKHKQQEEVAPSLFNSPNHKKVISKQSSPQTTNCLEIAFGMFKVKIDLTKQFRIQNLPSIGSISLPKEIKSRIESARRQVQLRNSFIQHLFLNTSNVHLEERIKRYCLKPLRDVQTSRLNQGFDFYNYNRQRDELMGPLFAQKHSWKEKINLIKTKFNTDSAIAYYLLGHTCLRSNLIQHFPFNFSQNQPDIPLSSDRVVSEVSKFMLEDKSGIIRAYQRLILNKRPSDMKYIKKQDEIKAIRSLQKNLLQIEGLTTGQVLMQRIVQFLINYWEKSDPQDRQGVLNSIYTSVRDKITSKKLKADIMAPMIHSYILGEIQLSSQVDTDFKALFHYYSEKKNDIPTLREGIQHVLELTPIAKQWNQIIENRLKQRTLKQIKKQSTQFDIIVEVVFIFQTLLKLVQMPNSLLKIVKELLFKVFTDIASLLTCYYLNKLSAKCQNKLHDVALIVIKSKAQTPYEKFWEEVHLTLKNMCLISTSFSSVNFLEQLIILTTNTFEATSVENIEKKLASLVKGITIQPSKGVILIAKLFELCPLQEVRIKLKLYGLVKKYIQMLIQENHEDISLQDSFKCFRDFLFRGKRLTTEDINQFLIFIALLALKVKLPIQNLVEHFRKGYDRLQLALQHSSLQPFSSSSLQLLNRVTSITEEAILLDSDNKITLQMEEICIQWIKLYYPDCHARINYIFAKKKLTKQTIHKEAEAEYGFLVHALAIGKSTTSTSSNDFFKDIEIAIDQLKDLFYKSTLLQSHASAISRARLMTLVAENSRAKKKMSSKSGRKLYLTYEFFPKDSVQDYWLQKIHQFVEKLVMNNDDQLILFVNYCLHFDEYIFRYLMKSRALKAIKLNLNRTLDKFEGIKVAYQFVYSSGYPQNWDLFSVEEQNQVCQISVEVLKTILTFQQKKGSKLIQNLLKKKGLQSLLKLMIITFFDLDIEVHLKLAQYMFEKTIFGEINRGDQQSGDQQELIVIYIKLLFRQWKVIREQNRYEQIKMLRLHKDYKNLMEKIGKVVDLKKLAKM